MSTSPRYVRVATLDEVRAAGRLVVQVDGHAIVLVASDDRVHAVDNRCPHMGFPLHRGTVRDGILTCHWHHARFDLATGGTFDPFADDVRAFPVQVREGAVWVDLAPRVDQRRHQRQRLRDGLERNLPLVIGKAVIALLGAGDDPSGPFATGLEFGARYRRDGWGQGLTILTCMQNLLRSLDREERSLALYHGLCAVAANTDGAPPRFPLRPLPGTTPDLETLTRWFRRFVEVRDAEGAERCIVSAVQAGADSAGMAAMLFAAATDHRYLDGGHLLDFTNKALEALDWAGWEHAELVLSSLAPGYAEAARMEESNAWRHPVDLVELLEEAFAALPDARAAGRSHPGAWGGRDALAPVLLGDDPGAIIAALLDALRAGAAAGDVAAAVTYAAALRIAHFHTSNEFPDWDTALHTFTFANAVEQGLRRAQSVALLRGVFDAAMSVYLDRFLNVPPARLPEPGEPAGDPEALLADLPPLLDRQQRVGEAAALVARYLESGGDPDRLRAALGAALLREDRNFHTIQAVEAALRQHDALRDTAAGAHVLIAATRYLAAHAPTMRAQGQTYDLAARLLRGERLYAEPERLIATLLFVDVVGSTERAAQTGDRQWRETLARYHGAVTDEVTQHAGRVVDTAGDGVLATFDRPALAIRAAHGIADAVRRLGLQVRAGVHTGEVEVVDDRVSGIAVHIAARAIAAAAPGECLATGTVRDLMTGSGVRFADRGTHTLKGVPGEWRLFAVERA